MLLRPRLLRFRLVDRLLRYRLTVTPFLPRYFVYPCNVYRLTDLTVRPPYRYTVTPLHRYTVTPSHRPTVPTVLPRQHGRAESADEPIDKHKDHNQQQDFHSLDSRLFNRESTRQALPSAPAQSFAALGAFPARARIAMTAAPASQVKARAAFIASFRFGAGSMSAFRAGSRRRV